VTNRGVHVPRGDVWEFLPYEAMVSIQPPADAWEMAEGTISVRLVEDRSTVIRIVRSFEYDGILEAFAQFLARTSRWVRAVG
jgi:hypothetical protein